MTFSSSRVAYRFLRAQASYRVYVDDDGYAYDERGDAVFIGDEYADRVFDLRDLPRGHPSYAQVQALIAFPPERRVQLALAAAATGDAKSAHFLLDTRSFLRMSSRQVEYVLRLGQKLGGLADLMPDGLNPLPTKSPSDIVNLKVHGSLSPYEAEKMAPYFDIVREGSLITLRSKKLNEQPSGATPKGPTLAPDVWARIRILDNLLRTKPEDADFIRSIRGQLVRGKALSDRQLAAIRRQLYMADMRPDAEAFRPTSSPS